MPKFKNLIHEIHRRTLWQVLGLYLVASWIALQVVESLVESAGLPVWLPGMALALLVIGFPVVMATAFVQEAGATVEPPTDRQPLPAQNAEAGQTAGAARAPSPAPSGLAALLTWRNAIAGGVMAFALWGVAAAGWMMLGLGSGATFAAAGSGGSAGRPTVAVLPFESMSTEEANVVFTDGIHEDVLTQISKIAAINVISRTSVLPYRKTELSLREIGDELGATAILEGSVRRDPITNTVRITAQLIDAKSDAHLWADRWDRELSTASVFAIQAEIAQHIADALQAALSPEEESRIARLPTDDLAAYDLFIEARASYQEYTEDANDRAIDMLRKVIGRDSRYAEAWAYLANAFAQKAQTFNAGLVWADSATVAAQTAIRLAPELAEAHKALALAYLAHGDLRASLSANLRAVELDPNHSGAINNIGVTYTFLGGFDQGLNWFLRSVELGRNNVNAASNVAAAYYQLGDRAAGDAWSRLQAANYPDHISTWTRRGADAYANLDIAWVAALSDSLLNRFPTAGLVDAGWWALVGHGWEDALSWSQAAAETNETAAAGHLATLNAATTLIHLGRRDEAGEWLDRAEATLRSALATGENVLRRADLAAVYALRGEVDEAFEEWNRAYEAGYLFRGLEIDPTYDALADDPRWTTLLERMAADRERMRVNAPLLLAARGLSYPVLP